MGEAIEYYGQVDGLKPEDEPEFDELVADFYDADITYSETPGTMYFSAPNGHRGGGATCEEIVTDHFGQFMKDHPHVQLTVWFTYLEQCPQESISFNQKD
jgi:hypothetical protein